MPAKFPLESLILLAYDFVYFDESVDELKEIYGVGNVPRQVRYAVEINIITNEERKYGTYRRHAGTRLSKYELEALAHDFLYFDDSEKELEGKYEVNDLPRQLHHAIKRGFLNESQRKESKERRNPRNKLTYLQLHGLAHDYLLFDDDMQEMLTIFGLKNNFHRFLKQAVRRKIITKDELNNAVKRRGGTSKLTANQLKILANKYVALESSSDELERNYKIKDIGSQLSRAVTLGFITNEQRYAAGKKQTITARKNWTLKPEAIDSIRISNSKLSNEQLNALVQDFVHGDLSHTALAEKYNVPIANQLRHAVKLGYLTLEQKREAVGRRKSTIMKSRGKEFYERIAIRRRSLSDDQTAALAYDYVYFDDTPAELRTKYDLKSLSNYLHRAILLEKITTEQFEEAKSRKNGQVERHYEHLPETLEALAIAAANRCKHQPGKYHVENRFFAASATEAAVALLFEKYLPQFKIQPGVTYQENGNTRCIFDFILPDVLIEWHPVSCNHDGNTLLPDQLAALKEIRSTLKNRDRTTYTQIKNEFEDQLAVEYWCRRQFASDNSTLFKGREVCLIQTVKELHQFLKPRATAISGYYSFAKEFTQLFLQVKAKYAIQKIETTQS